MRTIIIHPNDPYNCGDQLTYLGTKAMLAKALGGSQNLDIVLFDHRRALQEINTYMSQYCWGDVDLIALAGSPWFWANCEATDKYRLIKEACKRWPNAKKVGLGLGSAFVRSQYENIYRKNYWRSFLDDTQTKSLKNLLSQFHFLTVRDDLASYLLTKMEIPHRRCLDSSFLAHTYLGLGRSKNNKKVLFFYDPMKGTAKNHLKLFDQQGYIDYQIQWAKDNNADIFVNSDGDMCTLSERGIKASFSVDLEFLSSKFTEYDEMLSGRVHMAVLGKMAGISKITVLPIDSRFLTLAHLNFEFKFFEEPWIFANDHVTEGLKDRILRTETEILEDLGRILS